jgi:hypothetical protein
MRGWGAVLGVIRIGGRWKAEKQSNHINTLKMMAIFLALKSFTAEISNNHIMILCDNTTAESNRSISGNCQIANSLLKKILIQFRL